MSASCLPDVDELRLAAVLCRKAARHPETTEQEQHTLKAAIVILQSLAYLDNPKK